MKKVMIVLVLIALLFGVMPVSAYQGNNGTPHRVLALPISDINEDIKWIQVVSCFMDCYYQWYAVTDSTMIHGLGNPEDVGFEDLHVGQLVHIDWYYDNGLTVASLIVVMGPKR